MSHSFLLWRLRPLLTAVTLSSANSIILFYENLMYISLYFKKNTLEEQTTWKHCPQMCKAFDVILKLIWPFVNRWWFKGLDKYISSLPPSLPRSGGRGLSIHALLASGGKLVRIATGLCYFYLIFLFLLCSWKAPSRAFKVIFIPCNGSLPSLQQNDQLKVRFHG